MLRFESMNQMNYRHYKPIAIKLIKAHRDRHITINGFKAFLQLNRREIDKKGNAVILALEDDKLIGVLACSDQGREFAIVVVHRDFRNMGIAQSMLQKTIEQCGGFYCEIASDNLPSLKTCFALNMVAYDAFLRNGKVILKMQTKDD